MNDGLLHMIRSRNFGLDLDGILVDHIWSMAVWR